MSRKCVNNIMFKKLYTTHFFSIIFLKAVTCMHNYWLKSTYFGNDDDVDDQVYCFASCSTIFQVYIMLNVISVISRCNNDSSVQWSTAPFWCGTYIAYSGIWTRDRGMLRTRRIMHLSMFFSRLDVAGIPWGLDCPNRNLTDDFGTGGLDVSAKIKIE